HWAEIRDSKRPQGSFVSSVLIRQSDSPSPYPFQFDRFDVVQHQRERLPATDETAQASVNRPTDPDTGANPFPKVTLICRLPLPTLFYRLKVVHLGDLMRISGRPENTRHHRNRDALRKQRPYLQLNRFQGFCSLTREENSSSVSERRNQVRMRYRASDSKSRNLSVYDRLNHIQLLFTSNPSPLQSSRIELKYLLLPPRSALTEATAGPTLKAFDATATTLLPIAARR
ncbi:unnamed protein product, partial [Heligmosomoides polygyrus]|uniref:SHR-BD domain-containing protein n=1 Tax=Heligmosomoides polygyrus TaxID=6339 RepID=A0A183F7D6_HELPZ